MRKPHIFLKSDGSATVDLPVPNGWISYRVKSIRDLTGRMGRVDALRRQAGLPPLVPAQNHA